MSECPSFIKTYKEMREKYLLERELALMPETQGEVVKERAKRKATEELGHLKKKMRELKNQIRSVSRVARTGLVDEEADEETDDEEEEDVIEGEGAAAAPIRRKRATRVHRFAQPPRVVCKCPRDECRGFVTDSDYKCGLCSLDVCKDCSLVVSEGHTCKKEDVESATLLKQTCKPCPKCATPIFKIDGCDQMWCTQCRTAFSWQTGKVQTGMVHNPHYYEWQRQMHNGQAPRVQGDVPPGLCRDREVTYAQLLQMIPMIPTDFHYQLLDEIERAPKLLSNMHRYLIHTEDAYNHNPVRPVDNTALRIKFLLGEIDEKKLACKLQRVDKSFQKDTEVHQVFQTIIEGGKAIFQEIAVAWRKKNTPPSYVPEKDRWKYTQQHPLSIEELQVFMQRFRALLEFGHTHLKQIGDKYQMATPSVNVIGW